VGEDDGLDAVAEVELLEDVGDVGLDRGVADESRSAISAFESPSAIRRKISRSRAVSSASPAGGAGRGMRVNRAMTRVVTLGDRSASPAATVRTAAIRCSGGSSLSTKPLAPARSAS
jgi:hypothetical protein